MPVVLYGQQGDSATAPHASGQDAAAGSATTLLNLVSTEPLLPALCYKNSQAGCRSFLGT